MKSKIIKLEKVTDFKWLNLFKVKYRNAKGKVVDWIFASRRDNPLDQDDHDGLDDVDAVVIVPIVLTPEGNKIAMIKEYRVAINGFEYGFPAGLVDKGKSVNYTVANELKEETGLELVDWLDESNVVYSSPGLSDESCIIVFVEAKGEISTKYQESSEDIEVFLYDIDDVIKLLKSNKKVGSKAWGVLYYYSKIGKIE